MTKPFKTHGEVQAAIDAGEDIQALAPYDGNGERWVDVIDPWHYPPNRLRIKPKESERLVVYVPPYLHERKEGRESFCGWMSKQCAPDGSMAMRQVCPGDLTREQVDEIIEHIDRLERDALHGSTHHRGLMYMSEVRRLLTEGR